MRNIFTKEQKSKGLDARTERLTCTGLVVSSEVCRDLATVYRPDYLVTDFTRWVADTSLEYFEEHGAAPGRHMEDLFHRAKKSGKLEGSLATAIGDFLAGVSEEYEREDKFNAGYIVSLSMQYFRARALKDTLTDCDTMLAAGQLEEAEARWSQYTKVDRPGEEGTDPFVDPELLERAFAAAQKPLFTLPGAAGHLINRQLVRGGFLGILGKVKGTKSFTLQELGKRAAKARCNVAFIGIGDMNAEQYALRWAVNLAGRSNEPEDCGANYVPCPDCKRNQDGSCDKRERIGQGCLPPEVRKSTEPHPSDAPAHYVPCAVCMRDPKFEGAGWWVWQEAVTPLHWMEALKIGKRFRKRGKGKHFKLACYPSKGISPKGISRLLERWRDFEGFIPDVIIVDYADLMDHDGEVDTFRHQENAKWLGLRALSLEWNVLVITATQADAASYTQESLGLKNFNEDRRKYDHVTAMLGLHHTEEEKQRGLCRWSWLLLRQGSMGVNQQVVVCQSLSQGRPLIGSWWRTWDKDEDETETDE